MRLAAALLAFAYGCATIARAAGADLPDAGGLATVAPSEGASPTARGPHGAVATDQRFATATGLRILEAGGNAVDAAVAIGYTLAVTYPTAGNLGGGGFMLIRLKDGATHFLDFREKAPAAATADMYLDPRGEIVPNLSLDGPAASGVPGSVAGLEYARTTFGTLGRHEVLRDAIGFAERGFDLTAADIARIDRVRSRLLPYRSSADTFLSHDATPRAGAILRQPGLARTLRAIEARGTDGFYRGTVARRMSAAIRASGGLITEADLAGYRVVERAPLHCIYHGMEIVTAPLPSSGGVTMCETLGILQGDVPTGSVRSFENVHLEMEAERRAFADRNTQLGDPDFVPAQTAPLLARAYLAKLRALIAPERATPSVEIHGGSVLHEGANTTNFSVVDKDGNAVDVTYTLNNTFGSGFVAGDTGVLMNDEMDDFTSKPGVPNLFGLVQGAANAIQPGKRPLSSMTPSIVLDAAGQPIFVTGAAGGPRIITATMDTIRAVVDFHEDASDAVADPRLHMQWLPDTIFAETDSLDPATAAKLTTAGYTVQFGLASSSVNAVGIRPDGMRVGAHDPRVVTGAALAY